MPRERRDRARAAIPGRYGWPEPIARSRALGKTGSPRDRLRATSRQRRRKAMARNLWTKRRPPFGPRPVVTLLSLYIRTNYIISSKSITYLVLLPSH